MFHQFDTEMTFEELWNDHATRNITTEIELEKLMISSDIISSMFSNRASIVESWFLAAVSMCLRVCLEVRGVP